LSPTCGATHGRKCHDPTQWQGTTHGPAARVANETWYEAGSLDTARRANDIWKRLLAEYQQPQLDPAIAGALTDYVARRKREISNR
jgi:hypothetical protein